MSNDLKIKNYKMLKPEKEIQNLKEQIHELKEYLYSDLCKACGEAALELDKINQRLIELESQQNS